MFDPKETDLLIVDDDPDFRSVLARRLGRRGYRVHQAGDGLEALSLFESRSFHVATFDLMMPGMTGLELLERIRGMAGGDFPVILLTGQGTAEDAAQAKQLGAFDFLSKPIPLANLEKRIREACLQRGGLNGFGQSLPDDRQQEDSGNVD